MNASNDSDQPINSLGRIGHPDAVPHLIAALHLAIAVQSPLVRQAIDRWRERQ